MERGESDAGGVLPEHATNSEAAVPALHGSQLLDAYHTFAASLK
jgi:hypothetical protein